uniref:50S ribosomal protein L11 n=1 Tax=Nephromyces sp. ex Molgula occidentalis TaxID=2544991 RepID=A0A5C1H891_9APIC|nr:50S ribosomal protein L11 [Nephromyces sp. ex Molgula occidentalis]
MIKKLISNIKLHLKATEAKPNSFLSSILGPYGINLINFCEEYNKITFWYKNLKVPVIIFIYSDKTFLLKLKTPTVYSFIKKYNYENSKKKITKEQINNIIKSKIKDFPLLNIYTITKNIYKIALLLGVDYEL